MVTEHKFTKAIRQRNAPSKRQILDVEITPDGAGLQVVHYQKARPHTREVLATVGRTAQHVIDINDEVLECVMARPGAATAKPNIVEFCTELSDTPLDRRWTERKFVARHTLMGGKKNNFLTRMKDGSLTLKNGNANNWPTVDSLFTKDEMLQLNLSSDWAMYYTTSSHMTFVGYGTTAIQDVKSYI